MKWVPQIILFPFSLVLSILTAFLTFLLGSETALLYIIRVFCIFGALASFIQREVGIGISGLVLGFLFGLYGIPLTGMAAIGFVELINEKIKAVYSNLNLSRRKYGF